MGYSVDYRAYSGRAFHSACMRGQAAPACFGPHDGRPVADHRHVRMAKGGREVEVHRVHDGGWQGSRLMQVGFALGLEEGLDEVPMLSSVGGVAAVARVGYQDDTYLVGAASAVAAGFPALERALAAVGHRMRHTKCSAWAPACDDVEEDDRLPGPLRGLLSRLPRARGGFKLLGGAVQGAMEVQITVAEVGM